MSPAHDLALSISQLCAGQSRQQDFFVRFRELVCRYEGVLDVEVLPKGEQPSQRGPGLLFASAPIRYLNEILGELRVFIDRRSFEHRSPLPLVKTLARQLALAIQAASIHTVHDSLLERASGLAAEIQEHKVMERARGVLESRRLIPPGHGHRLLRKVSAQSGKTLRDVAQGIVSTANRNPWKFRNKLWS